MPYAQCPMPHAQCPRVPHLSEKGYISTTKLRKYLLAQSLITVTELGADGKFIDQIGLILPILAR